MSEYNDYPYCGTCLRYLHEPPEYSFCLALFKMSVCRECGKQQVPEDRQSHKDNP
jgi:hypothetical protein